MPKYEAAYPKDPDEAVSRCKPENRDRIRSIYKYAHERHEICQGMEVCLAMEHLLENLGTRKDGFIEIGSAYGGSYHCWASIIEGGPAISVDKPIHAMTKTYGISTDNDPVTVQLRNELWQENFGDRVHIVDGYSQEPEVIAQVEKILGDHKVDYLFIDGDHSYEPTVLDVQNYARFVRPGGFVGFHDIYHHVFVDMCGKVFREMPGEHWDTGHDNHCKAHSPTGIGLVRV